MSLDPQLAAFLDAVDEGRAGGLNRAFHELSPQQARAEFERSSASLRWECGHDLRVENLHCASRGAHRIALRLYRPAGEIALPLLVFLHGGGYVVGSLDSHDALCRDLAARARCAVLAVDYRLAPEHRFPAALEDAEDALRWLPQAAGTLGIDLSRLILGGDSAGATLATVLCAMAADPRSQLPVKPLLQLLCYPLADASAAHASMELFGEGYLLESATLQWFYRHYLRDDSDRRDPRVSPLLASRLAGSAPALIVLPQYDPLLDEGLAYARLLQAAGVAVDLRVFEGLTHDFLRMRTISDAAAAALDAIALALREATNPLSLRERG